MRTGHAVLLQFDLYHSQIMGGDLAERTRIFWPLVRHIQIAGVPGRHEPDVGEINYPYLFDLIDSLGYKGWIGCEYRPKAGNPRRSRLGQALWYWSDARCALSSPAVRASSAGIWHASFLSAANWSARRQAAANQGAGARRYRRGRALSEA